MKQQLPFPIGETRPAPSGQSIRNPGMPHWEGQRNNTVHLAFTSMLSTSVLAGFVLEIDFQK